MIAAGQSSAAGEEDVEGGGPGGGDEGEEGPSRPLPVASRAFAWDATLGTVSARPVARRISLGELAKTWLRMRAIPVPVRAISFSAAQVRSHRC
jgi:hypothetical protein